uniref:Uncharacterized protein n=1 Tax=Anopheles dirus TaxID=7168 RepID=A0A182N3U9_9DIPT
MSYVMVETTDATGKTELLAAPTNWVQWEMGESTYLCWPNHRSLRTLNALLNDEHSVPSDDWEKHKCNIICKHIPSLQAAEKILETMQEDRIVSDTQSRATHASRTANDVSSLQDDPLQEVSADLNSGDGKDRMGIVKALQQLIHLLVEMKSMMESNQEEMRNKLSAGFREIQAAVLSSVRQETGAESNAEEPTTAPIVEQTVMAYVMVETTDSTGVAELVAAPVSWIQWEAGGLTYLCWPNQRNVKTLQTLLNNECSVPTNDWEKHKCNIICKNIPSLEAAETIVEAMQDQARATAVVQNASSVKDETLDELLSERSLPDSEQTAEDPLEDEKPIHQMSYVMVETTGGTGAVELLAAPVSWIQWETDGTTYLSWPNQRNVKTLHALLNDDRTVPAVDWEKHRCNIICKHIPSLVAAEKIVETMQEQRNAPASPGTQHVPGGTAFKEEFSSDVSFDQDEDPLGDGKPVQQLINLIVELKSLIEGYQQEMRMRLNEGMSYVMVETTGATGNKELLATPASWIKWDAEGFTYLYWPNHRYLNKLKALLNDERSAPAADWEKHKCKILSKSIPSFVAADKMVQTLKRQRQAAAEASDKPQKIPVTVKKAPVPSLHDWVPKRSAKPGPNPVPVKEADEPNIQNELRRTAATPDTNMQDEVLMSYVVVETTGATGDKELLAAPTKWIKWEKGGFTSLRWPNQRYLSTLNALLNDAGSIPSADWEKHKCDIMCRNIPSLETAERMVEQMLEQRKGPAASEAIPVTMQKTEDPMAEEENLHEFSSNLTKVVDECRMSQLKKLELTTKENCWLHQEVGSNVKRKE